MKRSPNSTNRFKPENFKFKSCMPKGSSSLISLFLFTVVCAFLFHNFYSEAKKDAVRQLTEDQLIHAKQATHGIEEYFATWRGILASFARMDDIIQNNADGKRGMDLFYEGHKQELLSVTRVDEKGTIIYTAPYRKSIGSNISSQAHVREMLENHKPVISDVFKSVQGFDCIALHVPVFKGEQFKGTLAIVIDFQVLSRRYLEVIRIGRTGHARVISRDGTELYSPVPGHVGKSVFSNYKDFPSVLAMTREMLKGRQGAATYTAPVRYRAVYMPITIDNTFWSVVVACSEEEVLSSLAAFRNRLLLIIGVISLGGIVFATTFVKAWVIVSEEQKRKQAEKELVESERKFRTLFEQAAVGVAEIDPITGRFIHVNKRYCDIVGLSLDEMLRTDFQSITHPDDLEADLNSMKLLLAGEIREYFMEKRYIKKNGDIVWVSLTVYPIWLSGEKPTYHIAIVEDITERKQAEELRRVRETYFSQVFDTVRDIIFVVGIEADDTFRFTSVNRMFLETTGLSGNQVIGRLARDVIPEPSCSLVLGKYREAVRTGVPVHWEEVSVYPAGEKYGKVTVTPVLDAAGKCTQLIGTVHDITVLKRAQEELEQKVNERTRELSEANVRLTELDRLKSMFIASMSHELRTPLNSIIGFTGMTLQGLSGELNEEQKDNISRVYRSARHLLSLISDIIDISKIEAGRIDAFSEAFSVKEVIAEAIDTVKPQLKEKGLMLEVDISGDMRLNTDRKRLLQGILNFLSNAVKFTESGTITVAARETDGQAEISVSDTGIGIAEEDMPKLFEAFERLETHLRVKAGGTGLGLYLTKKIARDILHGDVLVRSREGIGSTFTLRVPKDLAGC